MTIYTIHFRDHDPENLTLVPMSTEEFRLEHGGQSDLDMVRSEVRKKWPGRHPVRIVRTLTGRVLWRECGRPA